VTQLRAATAAGIRSLVAAGDRDSAAAAAGQLIAASFGLPVARVELTVDEYSLNPARPAPVRMLGLAQAVLAGSEPESGTDPLTRMLDAVAPASGAATRQRQSQP
jgi:hypothetical protein